MKTYGGVEGMSALDGSGQIHAPVILGTYWVEDWAKPTASVDVMGCRRIPFPIRESNPGPLSP
jgi:hypothetical protein